MLLSLYTELTLNLFQPKPVVDTIAREEKHGVPVEYPLGRKVVKGVEGVSNVVNSAFEVSTLLYC